MITQTPLFVTFIDTAFKQQRLPAWQPVMTAKSVIPTFFVIGVIFVPLGAVLFDTSNKVNKLTFLT